MSEASHQWEYTHAMRLKSTLATLTALLLLAISCVASACEATCDLQAVGRGCHHASPSASSETKPNQQMAGISHCGMAVDNAASKVASGILQANTSCSHQVCAQSPTIMTHEDELAAQLVQSQSVIIPARTLPAPLITSIFRTAETPPLRAPLLISLQTIIRV